MVGNRRPILCSITAAVQYCRPTVSSALGRPLIRCRREAVTVSWSRPVIRFECIESSELYECTAHAREFARAVWRDICGGLQLVSERARALNL